MFLLMLRREMCVRIVTIMTDDDWGGWHITSITAKSKLFLFSFNSSFSGLMQPQVHFLDPSVQLEHPSHFRVRILPVSHSDQLTARLLDAQFCQLPMNQCMKNNSQNS
jgi:hypothetical protein